MSAYAFFFLSGFFINVGGPVSNAAAAAFGTDTAALGFCFSLFMVGRFIGITGNGVLVRKPGLDRNLHLRALAFAPLAAATGLVLATGSLYAFAAWIFLAGIGIGGIYSASNMILVDIFEGTRRAFHISMINFLYSVGAVFSPALSGALLARGFPWYSPYVAFAGALVLWLAATGRTSFKGLFSGHEAESPAAKPGIGPARISPALLLVCAAIVLVIFAEYTVTFWTPIYLREYRGEDALFSGLAVSAFWIAVLAGRFIESMLIARIRPRLYLIATGILAVAALLTLPFQSSRPAIIAAVVASGALCAGLFPALFTFGASMAESLKRTFPTLMMLSAATGSFLAMPAGSLIKKTAGMRGVMFAAPVAVMLTAAIVAFIGQGTQKKSGS